MDPEALGKITAGLDIVDARFVELVPNVRRVQAVDFVADDPANAGTMTMTWALAAVNAGTTSISVPTTFPPASQRNTTLPGWPPDSRT